MEQVPSSKLMGMPPPGDLPVPVAIGLEREGDVLLKSFCPPYSKDIEEAVLAFVAYKFPPGTGTFRDGGVATGWKDAATVQVGIPTTPTGRSLRPSPTATTSPGAYGRFPGSTGPFRTVLAYPAHHVDTDFYDRFYRPEARTRSRAGMAENKGFPSVMTT